MQTTKKTPILKNHLIGALVIAGTLYTAAANDWPQWRGPNRDDISSETGLLQDWPKDGPKLVWKAVGLGEGYSTVSVANKRIFTIGERSGASFVISLDETNGKEIWAAKLGKALSPGGYVGPRSTPTLDGALVYAVSQGGEMVCLDFAKGSERWKKDFAEDFGGTQPNWGFAESPLVDGNKVIITPGGGQGALAALQKDTGAVVWRSKEFTDLAQYSSLIVEEIDGVRQYIQLTASSVAGIRAEDGKLLWRASRRGQTAVIPTPIYHDGYVYVTSGYGVGCNLFKVEGKGGTFSAKEVYSNKVMVNHHGGAVLLGGHIFGYSDGKGWTCQDFLTGTANWQDKEKLGKGSVVFADQRLYLRAEDSNGAVVLIESSADGFKEHGRFNQPDRSKKQSWPHPVVANGRLYLRDQDVLLCYQVSRQ